MDAVAQQAPERLREHRPRSTGAGPFSRRPTISRIYNAVGIGPLSTTIPEGLENSLVRARGLEPPLLAEPDPKSGASAIPPRPHVVSVKPGPRKGSPGTVEYHGFATGAVSGTLGTTRRPSFEKAESYQFGAIGAPPLISEEAQPDERRRRPPMKEGSATRAMRLDFMDLESVTGA